MSSNLDKAYELENGIIVDGAVLFASILGKAPSFKPTYSAGKITKTEYYKSHTQIDANRLLKIDITYTGFLVTQEVWTVYKKDGVTAFNTYTLVHTYTGNDLVKSEGTET